MPSFQTDSPLDYKIKQGVINDCIAMLDLSHKRRSKIKSQKRMELQRRLLKGYSHKIPVQVEGGDKAPPSGVLAIRANQVKHHNQVGKSVK